MSTKAKSVLLILPTNHNQEIAKTLKLSTLIEIIKIFEKGNVDFKIATYRGIENNGKKSNFI